MLVFIFCQNPGNKRSANFNFKSYVYSLPRKLLAETIDAERNENMMEACTSCKTCIHVRLNAICTSLLGVCVQYHNVKKTAMRAKTNRGLYRN